MDEARFPFPCKEESEHVLRKDYSSVKIPAGDIPELIDRCWQIGVSAAADFLEEHPNETLDFERIFSEAGFRVVDEDKDFVVGSLRYFADIQPKLRAVNVYTKSVKLWAEENGYTYEQSRNIILMHEYFHYLEESRLGYTSGICKVWMIKIGKWKFGRTGIPALSEIAANAFACTLFPLAIQEAEGTVLADELLTPGKINEKKSE